MPSPAGFRRTRSRLRPVPYRVSVRRSTVISTIFYCALIAITVAILLRLFPLCCPIRLRHGSDTTARASLGVALRGMDTTRRPRLHDRPLQWPITFAAVLVCLTVAVWLFLSDYPSRIKTLNETFFALALLLPLIQRHRSVSPRSAVLLSLGIFAVIAVSAGTPLGTDLAETLGALLLFPIGFYVIDRGILDPDVVTSSASRRAWYALLLLLPIVMSILQYRIGLTGLANDVTRYIVRFHEAFVFLLLVEVFFAVGLGRRGRSRLDSVPLVEQRTDVQVPLVVSPRPKR